MGIRQQTQLQVAAPLSFTPACTGMLQRAAINSGPAVAPPIVHDVLRSLGQPLDSATRAFMEPRFGHDFSRVPAQSSAPQRSASGLAVGPANDRCEQEADRTAATVLRSTALAAPAGYDFSQVRVHTDAHAAESAQAVSARAYTVGRDIVFGAGQYAPQTTAGRQLLAHELTHVAQQTAAAPPTLRRDFVRDALGNLVSYEFRVGNEIRQPFVELAKRLAGDGAISDDDLRQLRQHALDRRGTLDDHERMFMAGLLEPANVAILRRTPISATASITFPFASISTARLQHISDLDRAALPAGVTTPLREGATAIRELRFGDAFNRIAEAETAASTAITAQAGVFRLQATALIAFAQSNGVPLSDVLRAMLAAASDNSVGDKLLAGITYAVAAAVSHPLANDLRGGQIKVDALVPAAFARLPGIAANIAAFYVTAAQGSGLKGDTIYLKTSIDITNLNDRSAIIHELEHAQQDKAASPTARPSFPAKNQLELGGYRAQGRYILNQIERQPAADRARSATQVITPINSLVLGGILLEGQTDAARYRPLLELVFGAAPAPFHKTPAEVGRLLALAAATIETALLSDIDTGYGLAPGATGVVEGLAGESIIHWISRI